VHERVKAKSEVLQEGQQLIVVQRQLAHGLCTGARVLQQRHGMPNGPAREHRLDLLFGRIGELA